MSAAEMALSVQLVSVTPSRVLQARIFRSGGRESVNLCLGVGLGTAGGLVWF